MRTHLPHDESTVMRSSPLRGPGSTPQEPAAEQVAAIVTTFAPDDSLAGNLARVSRQVGLVVLVDDTGAEHEQRDYPIENLVVLRNPVNVGIARSLNLGIEHAAGLGFGWVLTLDDDTVVCDDYVSQAASFVSDSGSDRIGIVALSRSPSSDARLESKPGHTIRRNIITSGSFFSVQTFRALGGFSEDLFIDMVDFDFCCRARKAGLKLVMLNSVGMEHKVGNSEPRQVLSFRTTIYHHAPFRLYYQARNAIVFARRHFSFDPLLCIYILLDVVRIPAKALLFEKDKALRLKHTWSGVRDGVLGRLGRFT